MTFLFPNLCGCCLAFIIGALGTVPASCQAPFGNPLLDERNSFLHEIHGWVDPFRPPVRNGEVAISFAELELLGTIEHEVESRSVAILARRGGERRIRATVGRRIGNISVVAIRDGRVDVVIEELGTKRSETITLRPTVRDGESEELR